MATTWGWGGEGTLLPASWTSAGLARQGTLGSPVLLRIHDYIGGATPFQRYFHVVGVGEGKDLHFRGDDTWLSWALKDGLSVF